ncbi:hypothetical protein QQ045_014933 [Rhodiola kirilowii]
MENQQQAIPDDALIEIASRSSSMQTLASLRATAKSLNLATYQPSFSLKHLMSGFLIQTPLKDKSNYVIDYVPMDDNGVSGLERVLLDFLPHKVKVKACSDALGMLYCESWQHQSPYTEKNHYVCNWVTREWLEIPKPKTYDYLNYTSEIIVMKSNPVRFKIVRLTSPKLNSRNMFNFNYICQVFDSEKPGKWRKLEQEIRLHKHYREEWIDLHSPMVTVNLNLHILVGRYRILAFDLMTEEWNYISTPEPSCQGISVHCKLSKYQGKLSLIVEDKMEEIMTLWVMEDYKNKIWEKTYQLCTQEVHRIRRSVLPYRFCNSETVLFIDLFEFVLYNFRNGSYKKLHLDPSHGVTVFGFESDFEKLGWKSRNSGCGCGFFVHTDSIAAR